jgi:hypothetical protein
MQQLQKLQGHNKHSQQQSQHLEMPQRISLLQLQLEKLVLLQVNKVLMALKLTVSIYLVVLIVLQRGLIHVLY